jgi:hypothetical protein
MKMTCRVFVKIWFSIFLLMVAGNGFAQHTNTQFGKNRIQYKNFDWRFYSSPNFDIYFYSGGEELAKQASEFLEYEYERLTDVLGYAPYTKTKIFLYNSSSDMQQSNVGLHESDHTVAGQTNFVKLQVEIPYPGTLSEFKHELIYRISRMLIYDMMFGGSLSDMFQNTYLMTLPEWFIEGASLYLAYGWNVEMDDYMRNLFKHRRIKKLSKFSGKDAALIGQSVWNFIAERYGANNVSNILNLTRITRSEESSIANSLGLPFKRFMFDWQSYYVNMAEPVEGAYEAADDELKLRKRNRRGLGYNKVKISPDGRYMAYSENKEGRYRIIIKDLEKGKKKTILSGGYKAINQEIDENIPLITWRDENTLAVIQIRKGINYLVLYDIHSKNIHRRPLDRFNQIRDFDFSSNGNVMAMSADINGQNDIFLMSLSRNAIKRVTNDAYDDINPRFIPNTSSIVFSSNRVSDSVRSEKPNLEQIDDNFNLFIYNADSTKATFYRITNNLSQDINPVPVDEKTIYYLSDQKGLFNIYKYDLNENVYHQVTKFRVGLKDYDLSRQGKLAFIMLDQQHDNLFYYDEFDLKREVFTPSTRRQEINQAKFIKSKLKAAQQKVAKEPVKNLEIEIEVDVEIDPVIESETDIIDTDNYVFDKEVLKKNEEKVSLLANYRKLHGESRLIGPLPYEPRFSLDNVVTTWVVDPLRGFGIQMQAQMNDMLENHKFIGGLFATTDLRSSNFMGEYQYLKHRVDFHMRYQRDVIFWHTENTLQRYTLNIFEPGASLPFTTTSRLTFSPFLATTNYLDLHPFSFASQTPGSGPIASSHYYGGARVEFVFDNTIARGANLFEGTRARVGLRHYENFQIEDLSFGNFSLDVRNYKKIHRELIFATRVFYGSFFGNNPQSYLLGGMDNWLFNQTEYSGSNDPLHTSSNTRDRFDNSSLLFVEYVTNLRGFNYNRFHGTNVLLFNAELRFPVVKYFHRGPIASNFLRNLQLIGFYDIGSAWTGDSPFSQTNSINSRIIKPANSPFQAEVRDFNNPWLAGYGAGIRTVILGYYAKLDVAWPVENYAVSKPRFYLTLGYDF